MCMNPVHDHTGCLISYNRVILCHSIYINIMTDLRKKYTEIFFLSRMSFLVSRNHLVTCVCDNYPISYIDLSGFGQTTLAALHNHMLMVIAARQMVGLINRVVPDLMHLLPVGRICRLLAIVMRMKSAIQVTNDMKS